MNDNAKKIAIIVLWIGLSGMSACGVKLVPDSISHSEAFFSTKGTLDAFLATVAICWPLWLAMTFGVSCLLTRDRAKALVYTAVAVPVMALAATVALGLGLTF